MEFLMMIAFFPNFDLFFNSLIPLNWYVVIGKG